MRMKKLLLGFLSCFMVLSQLNGVYASEITGRNLKQRSIATVEKMPNLPSNYKFIDWAKRGEELIDFVFDHTATNFDEKTEFSVKDDRKFSTIYRDDKYGGYMIPAFYGENRPIIDREINGKMHEGEDDQESISVTSALIAASLLGIDMNKELPDQLKGKSTIENGVSIETYLDNELKYYWDKDGVITNVPNGSDSKLQNTNVSNAYGDFWYLLIANQNFFRLSELNPEWQPDEVNKIQKSIANKMVDMVKVLKERNATTGKGLFDIQCFDFENMQAVEPGWRQPDAAAGTASILYYAYKIFGDEEYLNYAKECMDYLQDLQSNPYYENMLIDAVYLAAMMNAEVGTDYDISKFWNWITTTSSSSVRNWGSVNYSQDGIDVYGMTGEPNNGYSYFFNSIYPLTSILPAAKYDPSYAKMAGKWSVNIANASKYFLPSEWSEEHQTDGEFKGKLEESVLAYESLRKNDKGQNFYATGDAKQNATGGWMAGRNTTNFGLYGGFYTGFLGALVEETNVEGILKLDCNKTDYYQDDMYPTYLYYNPYMESKNVEIDLGNQHYDLYDSVTGMYLAKNVTGKQKIKLLADSARVIVLADPSSEVRYEDDGTTYINNKLVSHSDAEVIANPGTELITNIEIQGLNQLTQRGQVASYQATLAPKDNLLDSRIIWSITDVNGNPTDKATISKDGVVTVKKNGVIIVKASSIDGSGVVGEKRVEISGQTLASLSQGKETTTSSVNDGHNGNLAVDGDITTRWIANAGEENPWIYVDLQAQANIDLIILNWEDARPPKYEIQVSEDAQTWNKIASVDDEGNTKKVVRFEFDTPQEGRYVRIYANEKSNYGCSLYEFDIYGKYDIAESVNSVEITSSSNKITTKNRPLQLNATVLPENATDKRVEWFVYNEDGTETTKAEITSTGKLVPYQNGKVKVVAKAVDGSNVIGEKIITIENQDKENLALNKKVYVHAAEGANPKEDAVDGDIETRWALGESIDDGWITVDLGDIYDVNKVMLYWEASYASGYKIQGSLDNNNFFDFYETNQGQGGIEEVTFDSQHARYVRLQGTKRATSYGISLWEFEIYGDEVVKIPSKSMKVSCDLKYNTITHIKQEVQMSVSVLPENTTDKSVSWRVCNLDGTETDLASITKDGKLIAKKDGQVKIIATANDGSGVTGELIIKIKNQEAPNIALNKEAQASSQAANDVSVENIVDGDLGTRWASNNNNDEYVQIDLGEPCYINQILLHWESAYGKKYKVLGSLDGKEYFELYHEDNGSGGTDNIILDKEQYIRYVKMQGIERATNWGYSIYEFEVYEKSLKEDLSVIYDAMAALDESLYTPNSYVLLKKALEQAKVILDNPNATKDEIDEAVKKLNEASQSLIKRANMTELEKAIGKADKLKENEYTPNTYKTFKEALNNSKKVLNNLNATQENIDQATKKLEKAMSSLVKRADLTKLNKKIAEAKKLDETKYTTKTYKVLKEVLHNAENIFKDLNVTQSKVDAMVNEIEKAIMSLERVIEIDSDGQHKPGKPGIDENDSNQTSLESGTGVKTDDNTSIIIPLSLGVVALSGILYMIYLNKKVKKSKMS